MSQRALNVQCLWYSLTGHGVDLKQYNVLLVPERTKFRVWAPTEKFFIVLIPVSEVLYRYILLIEHRITSMSRVAQ